MLLRVDESDPRADRRPVRIRPTAPAIRVCCWAVALASLLELRASAQGATSPQAFCRPPDALSVFALTVRHVLRAQPGTAGWTVFQVPCDTLSSVADAAPRAILIADRAFVSDQDVLQYGFTAVPFFPPVQAPAQPDDPFARLGRWILQPSLTAVPSIWTRGPVDAARLETLRLAVAAGAVQALTGFADTLCAADQSAVPGQLLEAAEAQTRNHPDYHLYFEAALHEHRAILGDSRPLAPLVTAVAQDLRTIVVPQLRCDLGNRDRFSLMPFGPGVTSLTKAAEHIQRSLGALRTDGRSDLGQLNLARACVLDAVVDMQRNRRAPSCRAADYGLWTRAYAPLLHAAQVKVLQTSR